MQIDFGGIGKEYAVDQVVQIIINQCKQEHASFLVNFGGDLSAVKAETVATVGVEEISDNDIGGMMVIGLRHVATEGLELELVATHMDVFGYTVNGYKASGRLFIRKKFSVGFGYSDNDDLESLFLNVRMNI